MEPDSEDEYAAYALDTDDDPIADLGELPDCDDDPGGPRFVEPEGASE